MIHPYNKIVLNNKKKLLIHATVWTIFKGVILRKRSWKQKNTHSLTFLYKILEQVKLTYSTKNEIHDWLQWDGERRLNAEVH